MDDSNSTDFWSNLYGGMGIHPRSQSRLANDTGRTSLQVADRGNAAANSFFTFHPASESLRGASISNQGNIQHRLRTESSHIDANSLSRVQSPTTPQNLQTMRGRALATITTRSTPKDRIRDSGGVDRPPSYIKQEAAEASKLANLPTVSSDVVASNASVMSDHLRGQGNFMSFNAGSAGGLSKASRLGSNVPVSRADIDLLVTSAKEKADADQSPGNDGNQGNLVDKIDCGNPSSQEQQTSLEEHVNENGVIQNQKKTDMIGDPNQTASNSYRQNTVMGFPDHGGTVMNSSSTIHSATVGNMEAMQLSEKPKKIMSSPFGAFSHEDVLSWLEITGFMNEPYRNRQLTRYHRMKQLQQELEQLNQDMDMDKQSTLPNAPRPVMSAMQQVQQPQLQAQARHEAEDQAQPQPETPKPSQVIGTQTTAAPMAFMAPTTSANMTAAYPMREEPSYQGPRPKRSLSPEARAVGETHQRRKSSKNEDDMVSPRSRKTNHNVHGRSGPISPKDRKWSGPHHRSGERPDKQQQQQQETRRADSPMDMRIRGTAGRTRYFMIKSWNFENVQNSQREGIWATQAHNEKLLEQAFMECEDVILVFSVNKSMAFQGFARMESRPGTAPPPRWVKELLWSSSGAFRVRWLVMSETRFSKVGHLKNKYNEGQPVLVGRDGQEIEEECGRQLCDLLQEMGHR